MLIPDVEALAATYLRDNPAVAAIVGSRVVGRTPSDLNESWVQVTVIDERPTPTSRALHLVTALVQFDCYGSSDSPDEAHEDASDLVRVVRQALHAMPGEHDDTVVAAVTFGGTRRLPDNDFTPARERFVLDANITFHPA